MRYEILEGERLTGIDVEVKDGVLICPILICLRRVESVEGLGGFRVEVPVENQANKLPAVLLDVRLKIIERM
jgi:hypothetical protein